MNQAAYRGIAYYLQLVALITVYLAVFNVLPIPALDGGKLMFLAIEAVRRKPVPINVEQTVTAVFMFILIALMLVVTVGDIAHFF
jgi:regulator of sigma E protease